MVNREDLIYKANNYTCNFHQFRTTRSFVRDIYIRKTNLENAKELQSVLLMEIMNFNKQTKPNGDKKRSRKDTRQSVFTIFKGREMIYNAFENRIIPLASIEGTSCP